MRARSSRGLGRIAVTILAALACALPSSLAHAASAACGDTVTGKVVLDGNLSCTGNGLVVGADKVTIDLNGFMIEGDGGAGDVGIDDGAGFDQVTIKNGTVAGFDTCVSIGGDAQKTKITDVTAFGCEHDGFDLGDSDVGTVKGCFADGNSEKGFDVGPGGTGNKIEKSAAVGNGGAGFEISGTGNTLKKVDASGNNQGINLLAPGNTVTGCTAYRNGNSGVYVNADASRVSKCEAAGNVDQGIYVSDAAGVTVDKNTTTANRQLGILRAWAGHGLAV